jgi:16S rRNA C1402 (ribose-2'-O) methylase RsmI
LLVAAPPPANDEAASPRLRDALATADVTAAEDTRRLRRLLPALGVEPTGRIVSHFDQNEAQRLGPLLDELRAGRTVLVVSDAGTPVVSDPGFRLVAAAAAEGLPVQARPGPAAVCRELTKTYEEVRRGTLAELADWSTGEVRGEVTLVVAGAEQQPAEVDEATLAAQVAAYVDAGLPRRDAVDRVAAEHGLSRRLVYAAVTSL